MFMTYVITENNIITLNHTIIIDINYLVDLLDMAYMFPEI